MGESQLGNVFVEKRGVHERHAARETLVGEVG